MVRGGDLQSFPYGPVMFLIFLPISFLGNIFGSLFNESFYFTGLGLRFTLLIIDFLCLKVLKKIVYSFSTCGRTIVSNDIEWTTNNSKKIQGLY